MDCSTLASEQSHAALAEEIHGNAPCLPPVLCGFAACIDRLLDIDAVLEALAASASAAAQTLKERLIARAAAGSGGEFQFDWPAGPRFFADIEPTRVLLGGSSTQVAQQLATIGAKPLLALERRDPALLDLLHPNILLAPQGRPATAHAGHPISTHQIIEFTTSQATATAPRADRIILRFSNDHFEFDDGFAVFSRSAASTAGAAILSGYNALLGSEFDRALEWSRRLAADWRAAGTPIIHMELADFEAPDDRRRLLDGFVGICNSVGMNLSELASIMPGGLADETSIPEAVLRLASDLQLDRLNVHADRWSISFTRADPEPELKAIRYGCLAAAARAQAGYAVDPCEVRLGEAGDPSPWPPIMRAESGHFVSCSTPYLTQPATTIGLGDTFLAGTLAVLAQAPHQHCSQEAL